MNLLSTGILGDSSVGESLLANSVKNVRKSICWSMIWLISLGLRKNNAAAQWREEGVRKGIFGVFLEFRDKKNVIFLRDL